MLDSFKVGEMVYVPRECPVLKPVVVGMVIDGEYEEIKLRHCTFANVVTKDIVIIKDFSKNVFCSPDHVEDITVILFSIFLLLLFIHLTWKLGLKTLLKCVKNTETEVIFKNL